MDGQYEKLWELNTSKQKNGKKKKKNQLPLKPSIPKNFHNLVLTSSSQSILIEGALFD